jgi:6-pyruvoyl-tetrahydropterin synthase
MSEFRVFVEGNKIGARFHVAHRISGAGYGLDRLHGHTYELKVSLIGKGETTFLYPFEGLMDIMFECVQPLNNKVLLADRGGNVVKVDDDEIMYVTVDGKRYMLPKDDVFLLPMEEVTAEALVVYLLHEISDKLRKFDISTEQIAEIEVTLWEGNERGVVTRGKF